MVIRSFIWHSTEKQKEQDDVEFSDISTAVDQIYNSDQSDPKDSFEITDYADGTNDQSDNSLCVGLTQKEHDDVFKMESSNDCADSPKFVEVEQSTVEKSKLPLEVDQKDIIKNGNSQIRFLETTKACHKPDGKFLNGKAWKKIHQTPEQVKESLLPSKISRKIHQTPSVLREKTMHCNLCPVLLLEIWSCQALLKDSFWNRARGCILWLFYWGQFLHWMFHTS